MNKNIYIALITGLLLLLAIPLVQAGPCECEEEAEVDSVSVDFDCETLEVSWSHGSGFGSIVLIGTIDELLDLGIYDSPTGTRRYTFSPPVATTTPIIIIIGIFDEEEEVSTKKDLHLAKLSNHIQGYEELIEGGEEEIPIIGEPIAFSFLMINCDPAQAPEAEVSACADGRLTYTLCQPLVVYPVDSEDGRGLSIYLAQRGSDIGEFKLYLSAEQLAALPDSVTENCTIASSADGTVVAYFLTSGQYQLNVGPDDEGKVFAYIFNDFFSSPVQIDSYISGETPAILPSCN